MIPQKADFLNRDFEIKEQPSLAYRMNPEGNCVRGWVDGVEAVKQAIFRILNTERYQYIIYPWWYGIETIDLYGEPVTWVCPELERRITEALSVDTRIIRVTDFKHDLSAKGVVHTTFTVQTIYGNIKTEKEVKFHV